MVFVAPSAAKTVNGRSSSNKRGKAKIIGCEEVTVGSLVYITTLVSRSRNALLVVSDVD